MQASNGKIILTVILCTIALGVAMYMMIPTMPIMPTANELAGAIVMPVMPVIDTSIQDRICELTDGCEYWESQAPYHWVNIVLSEEDDIEDALLDLIGLDDDELMGPPLFDVDVKDSQVRDYSSDYERYDGNWETKIFCRVTYTDVDEDDNDHVYVVITSIFDEGEYDELSVEEVSRGFEF